jgi:murein DD-endopeptidase MepM/ murein hydrolase activator NlpD
MFRTVALALTLVLTGATTTSTTTNSVDRRQPRYRPPVVARVVAGFRAPPSPFGPGHRGIDYDTSPRQAVVAIGNGVVTFAGVVAHQAYVTVSHPDGLRSTTSVSSIEVVLGQAVRSGQRVGSADEICHLGVRRGKAYIDPALLFAHGHAVLVPTRATSLSSSSPR